MHSSVHCAMLFSTGYCSIHVYSETHQQGLLVAHYTCNRQSTKQHLRTEQHLRSHIDIQYEEEINKQCLCISYCSVQYFVSRFPTHKLLRHNAYTRESTTYTQTQTIYMYTQTVEVSTGPGRMRAGPGSGRICFNRAGPSRLGSDRTIS